MRRPLRVLLLAAIFVTPAIDAQAQKREPAPAGSPLSEAIRFELAVYYLPRSLRDPMDVLRERVAATKLKLAKEPPRRADGLYVLARVETSVAEKYRPPDLQSLQYFGRGISREQAQGLQESQQVLVLDFAHPSRQMREGLRAAYELTEAIARETGGLIWDEETREVFSTDAWRSRIATWGTGVPDASKHTVIHAYRNGNYVRAITLGMAKLGLPDVVVEDFSWSANRNMGILINLLCQAMAEGAVIGAGGRYDLELKSIRHAGVRDAQLRALKPNAEAVAKLVLLQGVKDQGDPDNRLFEIGFERYPGPDQHARQDRLLSSLFGSEDSVSQVRHTRELLAASERARAKLPALREAFRAGLQPGEYIQLKAPFATRDGRREWMWVEVTSWSGNAIEGLLKNEPDAVPGLHGGQIVKVRQEDIFDYIRRYPDGRQDGNETGAVIQKMQK